MLIAAEHPSLPSVPVCGTSNVSNVIGILTTTNVGQVPGGTLATVIAEIAEAVLGEDHVGGDAGVVADEAAVAGTGLAVRAVRVAASTAPRANSLKRRQ